MDSSQIPVVLAILSSVLGMAFLYSKTASLARQNVILAEQVSTNAKQLDINTKQVLVDTSAAQLKKDELVTTLAADWVAMSKETRELKERIVNLEKDLITREANNTRMTAEQAVRDTENNTKFAGLNESFVAQGLQMEELHDLLDRSYKQIVLLVEQNKTMVTEIAKLTGKPEEAPPEGDKDIQDKAQAADNLPA